MENPLAQTETEKKQQKEQEQKQDRISSPILYIHDARESIRSILLKVYFRAKKSKTIIEKKLKAGLLSGNHVDERAVPVPPKEFMEEFEVSTWQVNGRNVFTLSPKENKSSKHILYFHGGAYVRNTALFHWMFVRSLIRTYGYTVTLPDYPLAPDHTYKDTFAMVEPVYKKLITEVDQHNFIVMGDSAGGGLALALCQKMKKENVQQPTQLVLLCPWLDITLTNPGVIRVHKIDPMLGLVGIRMAGQAYAGDMDPNHYMLSPINGDVEGLPRISLFIGSHDFVLSDCRKFREICKKKGVGINYFEYPKMLHIFMLLGMPESQKVLEQIGDLINEKI